MRQPGSGLPWVERLTRRAVHLHARLTRGFAITVEACVLEVDGRILLMPNGRGGWHLPRAEIGVGEAATDALARALGLAGALTEPPQLRGVFLDPASSGGRQICVYRARMAPGFVARHLAGVFFSRADTASLLAADARARLEHALDATEGHDRGTLGYGGSR